VGDGGIGRRRVVAFEKGEDVIAGIAASHLRAPR
jgi:hypothetical protein